MADELVHTLPYFDNQPVHATYAPGSVEGVVQAEVDRQSVAAIANINAQRAAAQAAIDDQANTLNRQSQMLTDDFLGFRKGLRPAAYGTDNANVLSFDPLTGMPLVSTTAPTAAQSAGVSLPLLIGGLFVAFYFLKGKHL